MEPRRDPPLLDEETLANLRRYGLIERLLPRFLEVLPTLVAELLAAIASGDREAVCQRAHRLRGCAAQMGASALAGAVAGIEEAAVAGADLRDADGVPSLADLAGRSVEALAAAAGAG